MNLPESVKKRKLEEKKPVQLQCQFFIAKKNRLCPLGRKKDAIYCPQHSVESEERVPCPLDPKHTVLKKKLKDHLTKCNSKPKDIPDAWFDLDRNIRLLSSNEDAKSSEAKEATPQSDQPIQIRTSASLARSIEILNKLSFTPLEVKKAHHEGLQSRLLEVSRQKHPIQQSSLIGNMKDVGLLGPENLYLEFGCGKAELSRFINVCVLHDLLPDTTVSSTYGFGLIDRGVNRMKNDARIRQDCSERANPVSPVIKRTRIDIKDINLDKFIEDINPSDVVGVSKHLCGAATDLTLKLIINSNLTSSVFKGMLIAMCCRHVCDYDQLLPESKQYLSKHGFQTPADFALLKRIVSWAVCGRRDHLEKEDKGNETTHESALDYDTRERLGFIARRLIDESRVHALKQLWPQYNIQMFLYADKEITLENVCLCVTKK